MTDLSTKLILLLVIILWGLSGALQKVAVGKMGAPAVQMVSAGIILLVIIAYYLSQRNVEWSWTGTGYSVLAALASVIGSIAFVYLLRGRDVSSIIGYAAAYPLVTFILAILFLGESFTTMRLVGICLVLFGLMIIGR